MARMNRERKKRITDLIKALSKIKEFDFAGKVEEVMKEQQEFALNLPDEDPGKLSASNAAEDLAAALEGVPALLEGADLVMRGLSDTLLTDDRED